MLRPRLNKFVVYVFSGLLSGTSCPVALADIRFRPCHPPPPSIQPSNTPPTSCQKPPHSTSPISSFQFHPKCAFLCSKPPPLRACSPFTLARSSKLSVPCAPHHAFVSNLLKAIHSITTTTTTAARRQKANTHRDADPPPSAPPPRLATSRPRAHHRPRRLHTSSSRSTRPISSRGPASRPRR